MDTTYNWRGKVTKKPLPCQCPFVGGLLHAHVPRIFFFFSPPFFLSTSPPVVSFRNFFHVVVFFPLSTLITTWLVPLSMLNIPLGFISAERGPSLSIVLEIIIIIIAKSRRGSISRELFIFPKYNFSNIKNFFFFSSRNDIGFNLNKNVTFEQFIFMCTIIRITSIHLSINPLFSHSFYREKSNYLTSQSPF